MAFNEMPANLPSVVARPISKHTKAIRVPPKISLADLTPHNIGTLRKINSVLFPVNYSDRFYKEVLLQEVENYCKLIYYNDIPVGAICCRIERETANDADSGTPPTAKLYLMTLGVLAPYRRQGLASKLLSHILEKANEASLAASLARSASASTSNSLSTSLGGTNKADKKAGKSKSKPSNSATSASEQAKKEPDQSAKPPSPPSPILKSIFVHAQIGNDDAKSFWTCKGFVEKETVRDYYKKDVEGPRDAWIMEKEIEI